MTASFRLRSCLLKLSLFGSVAAALGPSARRSANGSHNTNGGFLKQSAKLAFTLGTMLHPTVSAAETATVDNIFPNLASTRSPNYGATINNIFPHTSSGNTFSYTSSTFAPSPPPSSFSTSSVGVTPMYTDMMSKYNPGVSMSEFQRRLDMEYGHAHTSRPNPEPPLKPSTQFTCNSFSCSSSDQSHSGPARAQYREEPIKPSDSEPANVNGLFRKGAEVGAAFVADKIVQGVTGIAGIGGAPFKFIQEAH